MKARVIVHVYEEYDTRRRRRSKPSSGLRFNQSLLGLTYLTSLKYPANTYG
ncbi:unnamed protein product [Acanthoscelides obtectus]|uniref:Uncharacterized protein n=1 Tax=Acanthoscelides obtectus TaxID=200917 RepID=A0A9P0JU90_ACAOB|nr:unnamed protein product [Acanthoscelides obtectus]CAK1666117.1 hypothetical protein AOBTE_LOCUS25164 [Acanthoscelides obtectus]